MTARERKSGAAAEENGAFSHSIKIGGLDDPGAAEKSDGGADTLSSSPSALLSAPTTPTASGKTAHDFPLSNPLSQANGAPGNGLKKGEFSAVAGDESGGKSGAAGGGSGAPASPLHRVLAAVAYGSISLGIVFFNKLALFGLEGRRNFLSMVQMIVTIAALRFLKSRGWIELADFQVPVAKKFLPVSVMSLANILSGLLATELLTVPMFSVLRRVSTLFTITAEFVFLGNPANPTDIHAVLLWVLGAAISGYSDLYFTVEGYLAAAANSTATALYYVLLKRVNEGTKLSSFSLLYYNSILSLPFQFALFVFAREYEGLFSWDFQGWTSPLFLFVFVMTLLLGAVLNYAIFYCVQVNSPTVTSITGQIKSVIQSLLGVFFFSVTVSAAGWLGIVTSTAGCGYYVYMKMNPSASTLPK